MQVPLSKPLPLDPLALLRAEEKALLARLEAVQKKCTEIEEQRKKEPVAVDTKQLEALDLDFAALTSNDVEFCERQAARAKGTQVTVLVSDREFFMQVAAKLSGVPRSVLSGIGGFDYVMVTQAVQNFFMTGSD